MPRPRSKPSHQVTVRLPCCTNRACKVCAGTNSRMEVVPAGSGRVVCAICGKTFIPRWDRDTCSNKCAALQEGAL